MSRLPATSAENLANELHRQLELVEFERDEAIRDRDEAQAVIAEAKRVVERWRAVVDQLDSSALFQPLLASVVASFDGVDGL